MKKVLGVIFLASTVMGLTGCTKTEENKEIVFSEKEFYEPKINIPKIYLRKGVQYINNELEEYIKRFAKITFDAAHVNETFTTSVDVSSIPVNEEGKLSEQGKFEVEFTVKYGTEVKKQKSIVEVVDRIVIDVKEIADITPFSPSMNMGSTGTLIDYMEGIEFYEVDELGETKITDMDRIVIDDATVRLSVPGVHLVKFKITCAKKYTYYYYREVVVGESQTPTFEQFSQYFEYTDNGLRCKRDDSIDFPKYLLVPSKFTNENGELVHVTKYDPQKCNFYNNGSEIQKEKFREVHTVVYDKGHTVLPHLFFAIDYWLLPHDITKPSIQALHLPETLETIESRILSGSEIKIIIIPRSVKHISVGMLGSAWLVRDLVFLGMPVSHPLDRDPGATRVESTARLLDGLLRGDHHSVTTYFYADYMLGISDDTVKNELFREVYLWARETHHVTNLNSFVNYNKIILD